MVALETDPIGPYRMLELLGRGGMGEVWRAVHRDTGREVALKKVRLPRQDVLQSLRREIHALASLRHPGIVQILDQGVHAGLPWYAMELLQGVTLRSAWAKIATVPTLGVDGDVSLPSTSESWWTRSLGPDSETPARTGFVGTAVMATPMPPGPGRGPAPVEDGAASSQEPSASSSHGATAPVVPGAAASGSGTGSSASRGLAGSNGPGAGAMPSARILPVAASGQLIPALTLVRRLCSALAYLHGEGLVHRDLKPDNILFVERRAALSEHLSHAARESASNVGVDLRRLALEGRLVVVDFGLASQFGGQLSRDALEKSAAVGGTVAYMAPEQARGDFVDARADLYALGCILFEMVTGRQPFTGASPFHILNQHFHMSPPAPSTLCEGVPAKLDELVLRLLAKRPADRFGHADDVSAALEALGAEEDSTSGSPRPRPYLYRPGFAGREQPMEEMGHVIERLAEGHGAVALLGGESGVGKTRLLLELAQRANFLKVAVLAGEALPESASASLGPLRRPLQHVADHCLEKGAEETERVLGSMGKILARYQPALGLLPGVAAAPEPAELPPEASRVRLFAALSSTFTALALRAPVLLLLDDLQWADELTLGWVEHVCRAGESDSVAIFGSYRTEECGPVLQRVLAAEGIREIRLDRLEESAVGSMVGDMLAVTPAPARFVKFLTRHSEGNPFFVAEYLRMALAEGVMGRDAMGRWIVPSGAEDEEKSEAPYDRLPLPRAIHDLVGRRLESLAPVARRLAESASVLGRELKPALLTGVAALGDSAMLEPLRELIARQVLEEPEPGSLRFVHDKIREVAYERIESQARQELHRAAAESLEKSAATKDLEHLRMLGHHWSCAGEELRAARCWAAAGGLAADASAVVEGLDLLDRAISVLEVSGPEVSTELIQALDARSRLRDQCGQFAEAEADARQMAKMAEESGNRLALGRALRQSGLSIYNRGDHSAALDEFNRALQVFEMNNGAEEMCETLQFIAWIHASRSEFDVATRYFQMALELPGLSPDSAAVLHCRMQLGLTYYRQGRLADARSVIEQLQARHAARGDELNRARCQAALGQVHRSLGDLTAALNHLRDARKVFERFHSLQDDLGCASNLGILLLHQGSFRSAASVFAAMRETASRCGENYMKATASTCLANCQLRLDRPAEAIALVRDAAPIFEQLRDLRWTYEAQLAEAHASFVVGDMDCADHAFGDALETACQLRDDGKSWHIATLWAATWLERPGGAATTERLARSVANYSAGNGGELFSLIGNLLVGLAALNRGVEHGSDGAWAHCHEVVQSFAREDNLSQLRRLATVRETLQMILLIGARISIARGLRAEAGPFLSSYRGVADGEHELHGRWFARLQAQASEP